MLRATRRAGLSRGPPDPGPPRPQSRQDTDRPDQMPEGRDGPPGLPRHRRPANRARPGRQDTRTDRTRPRRGITPRNRHPPRGRPGAMKSAQQRLEITRAPVFGRRPGDDHPVTGYEIRRPRSRPTTMLPKPTSRIAPGAGITTGGSYSLSCSRTAHSSNPAVLAWFSPNREYRYT